MGLKIAEVLHPSFSIIEGMESRGWTQTEFSRRLGISLQYTSDLIHAKRGISARVAEVDGLNIRQYLEACDAILAAIAANGKGRP